MTLLILDLVAKSSDERVLLVEVRKRQEKSNVEDIEYCQEKVTVYQAQNPEQTVLAAFLSLGGFTSEAQQRCEQLSFAWAEEMSYF
jgi:Holliday junction resolvase-like predicted endonuclease